MNLVYILQERKNNCSDYENIGVVTTEIAADKFFKFNEDLRRWQAKNLDDANLLNRISRESRDLK